jgi:hypothetical protein
VRRATANGGLFTPPTPQPVEDPTVEGSVIHFAWAPTVSIPQQRSAAGATRAAANAPPCTEIVQDGSTVPSARTAPPASTPVRIAIEVAQADAGAETRLANNKSATCPNRDFDVDMKRKPPASPTGRRANKGCISSAVTNLIKQACNRTSLDKSSTRADLSRER